MESPGRIWDNGGGDYGYRTPPRFHTARADAGPSRHPGAIMYTTSVIRQRQTLPPLLMNYLQLALPEAGELPLRQRIDYDGVLRQAHSDSWRRFTATDEAHIADIAYSTVARVRMAPLVRATVTEQFDGFDPSTRFRLWGVTRTPAADVDDLRSRRIAHYLAALPWMPYAVLANPLLRWHECGDSRVSATMNTGREEICATFRLHSDRTIVSADVDGPPNFVPWRVTYKNYAQVSGLYVPGRLYAYQVFPDRFRPYCRAFVRSISLAD